MTVTRFKAARFSNWALVLLSPLTLRLSAHPNSPLIVSQNDPAQTTPAENNWHPKTAEDFLVRGYSRLRTHMFSAAMSDAAEALKLRPASYSAKFLHGRVAYETRDYSTAIQDFNSVIQQNPGCAEAFRFRGLAYSFSGQHQLAIPDYLKFLQLKPYSAAGYNDIGWAYRELNQYPQSKASLDKAIEIEPDYSRAHSDRAILLADQQDWDGALADLSTLLNLSPGDQWSKDAKAAAEHQLPLPAIPLAPPLEDSKKPDVRPVLVSKTEPEYTDEARRAGVSAVIISRLMVSENGVPQDIAILRGAGFGLDENAIRALSSWRFKPGTREGKPVAAVAQVEVNMRILSAARDRQVASLNFAFPQGATRPRLVHGTVPENAKENINSKLRIALTVSSDGKPQNLAVMESTPASWAESALHEIRNWHFSPATLNKKPIEVTGVLELDHTVSGPLLLAMPQLDRGASTPSPDPAWQPKSAPEFLARGYARLRLRKYPQAQADAEDALKLVPGNPSALFLLARASFENKEYETAIADLDKLIDQKPGWPEAYRYRGLAYSNSGQRERAVVEFNAALKLDPTFAGAYNGLGSSYLGLANLELSKQNIDQAIELEPDYIAARENRAKLLARQGNLQAELDELDLILVLSPNNRWAIDEREALSQKLKPRN